MRLECIKAVDNFFEVLFDKHIPNGNDIHGIAAQRVCKVPESSVLLIITSGHMHYFYFIVKFLIILFIILENYR